MVATEQSKLTDEMHRIRADNESKAQLLYQQALQAGSEAGGGTGSGSAHSRERNIYDVRDYKIADLEKGASTVFLNVEARP